MFSMSTFSVVVDCRDVSAQDATLEVLGSPVILVINRVLLLVVYNEVERSQ